MLVIPVLYDEDDTIAQVKAKCEGARKNGKKVNMNTEGKRIIYKGDVLDDQDVISEKGIPVGAQLRLEAWVMVEWFDVEELEAEKLTAAWKAVGEEVAMEAREEGSVIIRYVARETMDHVLSRLQKEAPSNEEISETMTNKQTLQLMDVDAPLEPDLTLEKAGILPGGTVRMIAEVPPEAEPEPDAIFAAIKIQTLQRGWRARRAMAFVRDYDCKNVDQACWKAVIRDDAKMLALLIAHGGNRNAINAAGHSMDELARERGRRKVLAFLETGDVNFNPAAFDAAEKIRLEEEKSAEKEEELPEGQMKVVMVELKKEEDEMEATIHLDEEEVLMQQQAMFAAQQEEQRLRQEVLMEKLQDPRVREAVSLEALHSRLSEHRRIMQSHVSGGGWMGDSMMDESSMGGSLLPAANVSQPGTEVSANFTEWTRGKRRPRKQRPLKRRHTGTLAALVAEPLFLMQAEQPGMRGAMMDPTRGNLAMHEAMSQVQSCLPAPRPPRALPEPIQDMRGLERLWVEDQTSVHEALAKLERSGGFS